MSGNPIVSGVAMQFVALAALVLGLLGPLAPMAHDLLSAHMVQHLIAMNIAAPLLAASLGNFQKWYSLGIVSATALQLAGFWFWHMPAVFAAAHHSVVLDGLMKLSLLLVAVLFWRAVLTVPRRWPALFALLVTAKLFCLWGAVLVFARRPLYADQGSPASWGLTALADQQLAGLVMVSACALIYVSAATVIFCLWLVRDVEATAR